MFLLHLPMRDVPASWKAQLRELSFGPEHGTMWRWTFQNGSCYCSIAFDKGKPVAWACATLEDDSFPVVGVYVHRNYRKQGIATAVANHLLEKVALTGHIYAVSANWPAWPVLLKEHGLVHLEWE